MMIFRQLFDPQSSTYLPSRRRPHQEAVLIDPVFEHVSRDSALLVELGLRLVCTLDTHVHADHVTGAWMMKQRFGSTLAMPKDSGAEGADRYLAHGDRVEFGRTPSQGSCNAGPHFQAA
jgi:glyoxylase-like metal-dependent hydrolase (beta-lactamase superfamily II)